MNKENRNYQINQMKKQLAKRPTTKVDRFKMKKVKKIWVFACAVTTIFGVNAVMDMIPESQSIVAYAVKDPEYLIDDYYQYLNPYIYDDGGTEGNTLTVYFPKNQTKGIKSIEIQNLGVTITEFENRVEDEDYAKYTISSKDEPIDYTNKTKVVKYVSSPILIKFDDGTELKTTLGNGEAIYGLIGKVNTSSSIIKKNTSSFDQDMKKKAYKKYVDKANEIGNKYSNSLIKPKNAGEFKFYGFDELKLYDGKNFDENILDFIENDMKIQNNQFDLINMKTEAKIESLKKIDDAVSQEAINEVIKLAKDYQKKAKQEVFDTSNEYPEPTSNEKKALKTVNPNKNNIVIKANDWIQKINALDVERIKIEKPKLSPIKESDTVIKGTGYKGNTITLTN